jgi:hypothetical protein
VCRGVNIHTDTKGSVVLTLAKASVMRVSIPLDLSTRCFAKAAHDVCPCETERGELVCTYACIQLVGRERECVCVTMTERERVRVRGT